MAPRSSEAQVTRDEKPVNAREAAAWFVTGRNRSSGRKSATPRSRPSAKTKNRMKTHLKITLLLACGTLVLAAGCDRNGDATSPSSTSTNTRTMAPRTNATYPRSTATNTPTLAPQTNAPSPNSAEVQRKADAEKAAQVARAAEAQKQAEAAADKLAVDKTAADKAADLRTQTAATAAQEQARIQGLINTVTNLTGQGQYADALKVLAELATLRLYPEQQTLVDGLKKTAQQQATQAAADKAAAGASQAIGDALGGKK
jgi:hypothetical protein